MYCGNCGSKIYNAISVCPFCNTSMEDINQYALINSLNQVKKMMPKIDEYKNKKIIIGESAISPYESCGYAPLLNSFFAGAYTYICDELEIYIEHFSLDKIVETFYEKVNGMLSTVAFDTTAILNCIDETIEVGRVQSELTELINLNQLTEDMLTFSNGFSDLREITNILSSLNKTPYTKRWIGGGIGFSGMIVGSAKAGILNAGGRIANSISNAVNGKINESKNNAKIAELKNNLKGTEEFWGVFESTVRANLNAMALAAFKAAKTDSKFCLFDNAKLSYNYKKLDVASALKLIKENPYDLNAYSNLYSSTRTNGEALFELATCCGIDEYVKEIFLAYDKKIVADIDVDSIGFGMDWESLSNLKSLVDSLEKNNPVFLSSSSDKYILKEQEISKKINAMYLPEAVDHSFSNINELIRSKGIYNTVKEIVHKGTDVDNNCMFICLTEMFSDERPENIESALKEVLADTTVSFIAEDLLLCSKMLSPEIEHYNDIELEQLAHTYALKETPQFMALISTVLFQTNSFAAVVYLKKAAKAKVPIAMGFVGEFYEKGIFGFPQNKALSEQYLTYAKAFYDTEDGKYPWDKFVK